MKKAIGLIALGVVVMMPLGADKAHAYVPAKSERLDAKRFARDWWAQRGHKPRCYNIGFRWRALPRNELAFVASDRDGSSKCVVVFNSRVDWEYNQARDSESRVGTLATHATPTRL
jgi:hypothetical protein